MPYCALKFFIIILSIFTFTFTAHPSSAQLKPMDKNYTPPPMFGELETPKALNKTTPLKTKYFTPPLPPKRPKSFRMSAEMLNNLQNLRHKEIRPAKTPNIGTDINNDTGKDIRIMNAIDVLDSIKP